MATADEAKLAVVPEEEVKVDEELVEKAVKEIKSILAQTVIKGMIDVGAYVLKEFFNDDPELASSRNPLKNASYRSLVEKCETADMPVGKTWLNNAVGVAILTKALPEKADFNKLQQSKQTVLLPLHDPKKVEKVAARAVKQDLTVVELREVVRKEVEKARVKGEKRGRPPTPLIVKTLDRSLKLFTLESGRKSFTKAQVNELSDDDAKKVRESAEELMDSLKKLLAELPKK